MTIAIGAESPPLQVDETGTIRVGGTRVTFDVVIGSYQDGESPEAIAHGFPSLRLADVYATIAYYLRHREDLDAYLAQRDSEADALQQLIESDPGNQALRDRILARARARGLRP